MPTTLLDSDGTASMATLLMCSHHAFRRDLACFAAALAGEVTDAERTAALRDEWARFRATLHGHHTAEDAGLFPDLRARRPELAAAIDRLDADHRAIDPLLERGDAVFADLAAHAAAAREVIATLSALIAAHLELEEQTITSHLRDAKQFPLAPTEDVVAVYAEGFAWSSAGIAPDVLDRVFALLPDALRARLPAARAAFDDRSRRVWGHAHAGVSTTSVPA